MTTGVMMTDTTDLVTRLRRPDYWFSGSNDGHEGENDTPREAADAIEAMAARIADLEEAERESKEAILTGSEVWTLLSDENALMRTRIEELAAQLRLCADDLEAEINARYAGILHHPCERRKYECDMSTVDNARAVLEKQP